MKSFKTLAVVSVLTAICLTAISASAIEPIPNQSGFTGYINVGAAYVDAKSNMLAGNDFADIGHTRISSLLDEPDSESDTIPMLNFELRYTFADTRTQLYAGNLLEDFIRFDTATLAGIRQELPDKSLLALSYVFSSVPTEVWADPYVVLFDRIKTDRQSSGLRLTYDKILGSDLQVDLTWRNIEIDDELSGRTPGTLGGLALSPFQSQLLDREGDQMQLEVLYAFKFDQKRHSLVPAIRYNKYDLDGDAMANDGFGLQLTHFYNGERFNFATNLNYAMFDYDATNPIYLTKQEDDNYGGSFSVFYKQPFGIGSKDLQLVGTVAAYKSDSNIDFYDTTITLVGVSVFYRF